MYTCLYVHNAYYMYIYISSACYCLVHSFYAYYCMYRGGSRNDNGDCDADGYNYDNVAIVAYAAGNAYAADADNLR